MTRFSATPVNLGPVWDDNTDETVLVVGAASTGTYIVPDNCYAIFVSTNDAHGVPVYMSPDQADVDSGLSFNNTVSNDIGIAIPVKPGTTIYFHNSSGTTATNVNVVQFYNLP